MPSGQHAENLAWLRARDGARVPGEAGPARLWARALAGEGELLRVSPHRTVLRLDAEDLDAAPHGWLVKLMHPRRRGDAWRNRLRTPPALREHEAWQRLAARLGISVRAFGEQLTPELGVFIRAYWQGEAAQADAATARGLAALHGERWVDRDLALDDLLWVEDDEGAPCLLPLDLGHADVALAPRPPEELYRALVRLLAGLPAATARSWAPTLLSAHAEWLHNWEADDLVRRSRLARKKQIEKRSARSLRTCSDFVATPRGARRRGFEGDSPAEQPTHPSTTDDARPDLLAAGPRSQSLRVGKAVWKWYPRAGAWEAWRRRLGAGPARRAYRQLAMLELAELAATQPLAYETAPAGEWLATTWIDGRDALASDLPALAAWLGQLHREGWGLRDAKASNFRIETARGPVLIDADGLTPTAARAGRDLARLLAEHPDDGPATDALHAAYLETAPPPGPRFDEDLRRSVARFRSVLAQQQPTPAAGHPE